MNFFSILKLAMNSAMIRTTQQSKGNDVNRRIHWNSYHFSGFSKTFVDGIRKKKLASIHASIGPLNNDKMYKYETWFSGPKMLLFIG